MSEPPPVFDDRFAAQLETLLRWRRDVRHFDRRAVDEADMTQLLASAQLAPSVGNAQPCRWVRIRSAALRAALADHVDAHALLAAERYRGERRALYDSLKLHGIREAPELLAVFCDERPSAGDGLGTATMAEALRYSTVMAIHGMWLAARARGIGLGWVSILDPGHVTRLLDVPADWTLIALLCLGYPAEAAIVPELERRSWQAREPLGDRVFDR